MHCVIDTLLPFVIYLVEMVEGKNASQSQEKKIYPFQSDNVAKTMYMNVFARKTQAMIPITFVLIT